MKMKKETFTELQNEMLSFIMSFTDDSRSDNFPLLPKSAYEHYESIGLSKEQCRWDFFWGMDKEYARKYSLGRFSTRLYYEGLNDSHIDTALRKIFEG
jgi:hypothetical protein